MPLIIDSPPSYAIPATALDLRLVKLSPGGRPIEIFDFNNGLDRLLLKNSLAVTPPERVPLLSSADSRFGGSRVVSERQDNAQIAWTQLVTADSHDEALAAVDELAAHCNDALVGRLIERRRKNTSYPTYHPIRGPGSFTPAERPVQFEANMVLPVEVAFPIAPLSHGLPLDIFDPFDADSIGTDYAFNVGLVSQLAWNAAGYYFPISTARKAAVHSARGYRYENAWATLEIKPDTASAGQQALVKLCQLDASNYLWGGLGGANVGVLAIGKVDGGISTDLASDFPTVQTPPAGAPFFVRLMKEGNALRVEYWTSEPTPLGAPADAVTHTLAGADAVKFGSGAVGDSGFDWTPVTVNDQLESFRVEPYSRRNITLPETIKLGGAIPGSAPALCDLEITPSGGAAPPISAVIGWARRPTPPLSGAVAPFGIFEAESAGDLSGWAVQANTDSRGGSRLNDTTPSSTDTYTASWVIDPSALDPDEFGDEIALTVFCRALLTSSLVTPKLVLSARPFAGTNFGAERFSEWGSQGKLLTIPSAGTVRRPVKLGTLILPAERKRAAKWKLWLQGALGPGSAGANWGLDYLFAVPARASAYSPTGEPNDTAYPKFVRSTGETRKRIGSDLRGFIAQPPSELVPDVGLGGSEIELPPGNVDVAFLLSSVVPDDSTSDASDMQTAHSASLHARITPRYPLGRGE